MTPEEFTKKVVGRTITAVKLDDSDSLGRPVEADEVVIIAMHLDNDTAIFFSGSEGIGVDSVWCDLVRVAKPEEECLEFIVRRCEFMLRLASLKWGVPNIIIRNEMRMLREAIEKWEVEHGEG